MTAFIKTHSSLILMSLLVILLALAWIFPSSGLKLGIVFLLAVFLIASSIVLEKHKNAYQKGTITRRTFIRNAVLEISGTWVIMVLAGLSGRYAAGIAAQQIGHDLVRVAAGIAVALLVGLGIGALANKTLRRLVDVS